MSEPESIASAVIQPIHIAQESQITLFWQRYHELKDADTLKNKLIEELIVRYEFLNTQFKKKYEDFEREQQYSRSIQITKKSLEEELLQLNQVVVPVDPFAVVLLDGECMLFHDDLVNEGVLGGQKAARMLYESATAYVRDIIPHLPQNIKVFGRVYANIKSLAERSVYGSIAPCVSVVEAFAHGFTQAYSNFDFIDVRSESGVVEKIRESANHYLNDLRCKHIVIGSSANPDLVPYLSALSSNNPNSIPRITLLQGLPFHPSYATTQYEKVLYGSLFRSSLPAATNSSASSRKHSTATATDSVIGTPPLQATWAAKAAAAVTGSQSSAASTVATSDEKPPCVDASVPSRTNTPSSASGSDSTIMRNKDGQRLDPPVRQYNKEEVNRIKKLKLCNVHFLRPPCPYGDSCTHKHSFNANKNDLDTLKLVARMAPCVWGPECDDAKCIYGHRCPAPDRKDGRVSKEARKEGKCCIFGVECRFSGEMHGGDNTVVKEAS